MEMFGWRKFLHGRQVADPVEEAIVPGNDASVAARIMRKNKIHHVVVTHEKRVVGIISSFDLLKLVEEHRFVAKGAPSRSKKGR